MRIESLRRTLCAVLLAMSAGQLARAAEPGFYVGVAAGQTDYDVAASDGIAVLISGLPSGGGVFMVQSDSTQVEDDGVSWSAILGYRIHTYVAAELGYMSFAKADVTETFQVPLPVPFAPRTIPITQRTRVAVEGPAMSLLGILPLSSSWEAYLRGGVLFADQEQQLMYTSGSDEVTFGSKEWLAGVGVQWTFAGRWGLRLEYQRTDSIEGNARTGEIDLDQLSLTGTFAL